MQVWYRSGAHLAASHVTAALEAGHRVVVSGCAYLYGSMNLDDLVGCDPLFNNSHLPAAVQRRVIGGEAALWGPGVSAVNLDAKLFPKLLGFGERLWTAPSRLPRCKPGGAPPDMNPSVCNLTETRLIERAHAVRCRLVARGVGAAPLRDHWCALRDVECPRALRRCRPELRTDDEALGHRDRLVT